MLIQKGNITRGIAEDRIEEYKAKGYEIAGESNDSSSTEDKPIEKMTKAELTQYAKGIGVNVSEAKTKEDILDLIKAASTEDKPGEDETEGE